jgi:hypothetical protein
LSSRTLIGRLLSYIQREKGTADEGSAYGR